MFRIHGDPLGQPRHRVGQGRAYLRKNEPIHAWKGVIQYTARRHFREPLAGPVCLLLVFCVRRPAGHYRTKQGRPMAELKPTAPVLCTTTPDFDNLAKAISDALNGIAFDDDRQVCFAQQLKLYVDAREEPGVEVLVGQVGGGVVDSLRSFVRSLVSEEVVT